MVNLEPRRRLNLTWPRRRRGQFYLQPLNQSVLRPPYTDPRIGEYPPSTPYPALVHGEEATIHSCIPLGLLL